jgi:hypothetical protein
MNGKIKPDWAGEDFLSRIVNVLIQTKPIYAVMKQQARQVLIKTAEKMEFLGGKPIKNSKLPRLKPYSMKSPIQTFSIPTTITFPSTLIPKAISAGKPPLKPSLQPNRWHCECGRKNASPGKRHKIDCDRVFIKSLSSMHPRRLARFSISAVPSDFPLFPYTVFTAKLRQHPLGQWVWTYRRIC